MGKMTARFRHLQWLVSQRLTGVRTRAENTVNRLGGPNLGLRTDVTLPRLILGAGDGAWCIYPDGLSEKSVVYSVGVGHDISFDLALIERFRLNVHAFDPTPVSYQWLSRQKLPEAFHFHPVGLAAFDGVAHFELPTSHGVSFTMSMKMTAKAEAEGEVLCLDSLRKRLQHETIDLLKIDIEGTEYDVIPEIARESARIGQLLVEFHHRNYSDGTEKTRRAIRLLRAAGFLLFDISERGLEYSFVNAARVPGAAAQR